MIAIEANKNTAHRKTIQKDSELNFVEGNRGHGKYALFTITSQVGGGAIGALGRSDVFILSVSDR